MRECSLSVVVIGGIAQLDTTMAGGLCEALRCLADCMAEIDCLSAVAVFDAGGNNVRVRWGLATSRTENAGEIAIATQSGNGGAIASSAHSGSSTYAAGGNDNGAAATALASGEDSFAHACGGRGQPGGSAIANAPAPGGRAWAEGGRPTGLVLPAAQLQQTRMAQRRLKEVRALARMRGPAGTEVPQ